MDKVNRYKAYTIRAYEREPGHWLAEIRRLDAKNIRVLIPPGPSQPSITTSPAQSAEQAAIDQAKRAIDGGRME